VSALLLAGGRSTHSGQLERWLGKDAVERMSRAMTHGGGSKEGTGTHWYGPPIAIAGVPGSVYATRDGDFVGRIKTGKFASALDAAERVFKMYRRVARAAGSRLNGFASLSDLISEATANGKRQVFQFNKVGPTGVVAVTSTLWRLGNQPVAGAAPGSAPGGTATTSATVGAFPLTNVSTDTQHFVVGYPVASQAGNTLLLYDRLFHVLKTMASTSTEAVTGTFSRYQNTTGGAADSIGGNFCFVEVGGTALAATAHNWTVCQYTNQAGTTAQSFPSMTGNASAIVDRLDHPTGSWFFPLASGDSGVKALTQMQCSASVATGVINFVVGHPIAWMPCPIANMTCIADGINTSFNLQRIFDNACLALLETNKPSTTATTYTGQFETAYG